MNSMETILAWSGGKDSTATGILAKIHGIKIDEIVTVMPDPFEKEFEFIERFEEFMGQKVTIIKSPTFEDYFYRVKKRGLHKGTIYGFPFTIYKTCARILKWEPMEKYLGGRERKTLIGVAKGENRKLHKAESLLIKYGLTEDDARELCVKYDLLNPLYSYFKRLGCVRCPKQGRKALEGVRMLEPNKWNWLVEHDSESPVKFKPNKTLKEFMGDKFKIANSNRVCKFDNKEA